MDLNGCQAWRSVGCCVCTHQYASGLAERSMAAPSEPLSLERHTEREREDDAETIRVRFKQRKSVLGSSVLTQQSTNTSFCFSPSLSLLLALCQQCMTNEYKTPSGCIHPCVPLQLMMFILFQAYLSLLFFPYLVLIYFPSSLPHSSVISGYFHEQTLAFLLSFWTLTDRPECRTPLTAFNGCSVLEVNSQAAIHSI